MNVLSCFDGISAGRLALDRADIKYKNYFASEIDKYAITIATKNYPDTIHLGDITKVKAECLPKIDLLIGGSPCQGFSFAGKQLNFDDPRSKLFFEFVRLKNECKPKYFFFENVKMKKEYQKVISDLLGVEPIEINSALVSAQNRKRLYWTNIPFSGMPGDKGMLLKDIIVTGEVDRGKSYCIDACYYNGGNYRQYTEKCRRQLVRNTRSFYCKSLALTTNANNTGSGVTILELKDGWRKLHPIECERLQTFPDNWTDGVSNSQRYKMLGNSWTVDVIAHFFKGLK